MQETNSTISLERKLEQDIATSIIYRQNLNLNANFLAMLSCFIRRVIVRLELINKFPILTIPGSFITEAVFQSCSYKEMF